jgi:hypothetical protein
MMIVPILSTLFPRRARPAPESAFMQYIRTAGGGYERMHKSIKQDPTRAKQGCAAIADVVEDALDKTLQHVQARQEPLGTEEAWKIVKFVSRSHRALKDTTLYLTANEPYYFMIKQSMHRCKEKEMEIFDKLVPSFAEVPHSDFLEVMRLAHIEADLYGPLKEKYELFAFSHNHPAPEQVP